MKILSRYTIKGLCCLLMFLGLCVVAEGKPLASLQQAVRQMYGEGVKIEEREIPLSLELLHTIEVASQVEAVSHPTTYIQYRVFKNQELVGWLYHDTVMGKWGPIEFVLGLDPSGRIKGVVILDYQEIRGKPIAKKRFLKQYFGKSIRDPLQLRRDIDGITGATISSRSLTDGIRFLLYLHQEIKPLS